MAAFAACRYQPTPVPLQASAADIAALAGTWEGEYASGESSRNGSISFTVQPGKDTAFGDVLMMSAQGQHLIAADAASNLHVAHSPTSELLRITLVRVRGGMVEGVLEPYVAPDCKCVVSTKFRGAIRNDAIEGDYVTTGEYGLRQTGSWRVTRKPERKSSAPR